MFVLPFVAYEHDHHVAVAVLPGILQPCGLCGTGCEAKESESAQICMSIAQIYGFLTKWLKVSLRVMS